MNPVPAIPALSAIEARRYLGLRPFVKQKVGGRRTQLGRLSSTHALLSSVATNAPQTSAGALLHLIREAVAVTRAELARVSGLARSTVAQRVEALLASGLVYDAGGSVSTGGRPPAVLAFNRNAGVVLTADLGATHARLAVSDLGGTPLAEGAADLDIALGPEAVLDWVTGCFTDMLGELGRSGDDVRGIGVGVPGPVEFDSGRPVNPPIMPGWDDFPIPEWFHGRFRAPVLVDNDVNIMARGEHRPPRRSTARWKTSPRAMGGPPRTSWP